MASLIIVQLASAISAYLHLRAKVKVCGTMTSKKGAACPVSTWMATYEHIFTTSCIVV